MRIQRRGDHGAESPVVEHDGVLFDLTAIDWADDIDPDFFAAGGIDRLRDDLEAGRLPAIEAAPGLRIGAPIARPGAIVCIGQNYAAHAAESNSPRPEIPIIFFKHPNTITGPYDDIPFPKGAEKVDWEVELGVVIGREASYLASPDEALGHVAGYVLGDDLTERAWQREHSGGQWSKGKNFASSCPLGPDLVPADELDPQALRLRSAVNGEERQNSSTADMVFTVAHLVHHLSQYMVLSPGDLILTGTPQGVAMSGRFAFLRPGDEIATAIEGLGEQRNRFV